MVAGFNERFLKLQIVKIVSLANYIFASMDGLLILDLKTKKK
jgi:hypothetical protein